MKIRCIVIVNEIGVLLIKNNYLMPQSLIMFFVKTRWLVPELTACIT